MVDAVLGGDEERPRLEMRFTDSATTTVHVVEVAPLWAGGVLVGTGGLDAGPVARP